MDQQPPLGYTYDPQQECVSPGCAGPVYTDIEMDYDSDGTETQLLFRTHCWCAKCGRFFTKGAVYDPR